MLMDNAALAKGKLSLDKSLGEDKIAEIMTWVSKRRVKAFNFKEVIREVDKIQLNKILTADGTGIFIKPIYDNLSEIRG